MHTEVRVHQTSAQRAATSLDCQFSIIFQPFLPGVILCLSSAFLIPSHVYILPLWTVLEWHQRNFTYVARYSSWVRFTVWSHWSTPSSTNSLGHTHEHDWEGLAHAHPVITLQFYRRWCLIYCRQINNVWLTGMAYKVSDYTTMFAVMHWPDFGTETYLNDGVMTAFVF